jgi:hypothetical protein
MIVSSGKQLTVAEPFTMLLLASGLVVLAGVMRTFRT